MLPCPDTSLADRDPQLPGLLLLLDTSRLSAWVSELLDRPVTVQRRYLRYKPGTSCVLHADVDGLPVLVSAHRPTSPEKHQKIVDRAGNAVIGQDRRLGVLLATPAADRHLRALGPLLDPDRRPDALRRLGLGAESGEVAEPKLLRYKPHRRYVARLAGAGTEEVLLRVYERGGARAAAERLSELRSNAKVLTPRLLGRDFRRDALAVEFLPGRPVEDAGPSAYEEAGRALGHLHGLRELRLRRRSTAEEIRAVRSAARHLGILLPDLAARAQQVGDQIITRLQQLPPIARPAHGDFSADQAVRGPDGRIGLIDLDAACIADPASDLGSAEAALLRDRSLGLLTAQECANRGRALREGYTAVAGPLRQDRLAVHTAAQLLRRTYEPFRLSQSTRWDAVAAELLEVAGSTLTSAEEVRR